MIPRGASKAGTGSFCLFLLLVDGAWHHSSSGGPLLHVDGLSLNPMTFRYSRQGITHCGFGASLGGFPPTVNHWYSCAPYNHFSTSFLPPLGDRNTRLASWRSTFSSSVTPQRYFSLQAHLPYHQAPSGNKHGARFQPSSSPMNLGPSHSNDSFGVTRPIGGRSTLRASGSDNDVEDPSPLIAFSSSKEDPSYTDSEEEFDWNTVVALVGGQSTVIFLAMALTIWVSKAPGFLGLGENFSLWTMDSWQLGVLAVVPLAFWAFVLDLVEDSVPALQMVTKATQRSVLSLLGAQFLPLTGLVVAIALGIAAGVGEEWLFRGFLQTQLTQFLAGSGSSLDNLAVGNVAWIAVLSSSVLFGALHAVTPLYAFLATLASLYFGFLYLWTDQNLAIPMICHAVYDIGALYYAHWTVAYELTPQERRALLREPL